MHDSIGTPLDAARPRMGPSVGMPVPSITTASTGFQIDCSQRILGACRGKS